ncbi:MAG TPA: DUF1549 and DUF1553 domain-containing protein [Bryobacteraceae bacterium]|nr:DUF1549 and DUF1553 domain-containing protein [Bryobacteraceae bacterium]
MTARILIAALTLAPLAAAANEKPKLSFVKDIVPIFTKSGCANSNCHGSIRGQAGFKLSLFGYEPDLDYDAIVKAQDGRRINRTDPAKSLILMKPTFGIPHGGGERFKAGSLEYDAILDWIKDGATYDSAGSPRLRTIRVTPEEVTLIGLGSKRQLSVSGTYTDGTTEDLTRKVQYTANDESVLDVSPNGEIAAKRAGETAIMVRTLGKAVAARIAVIETPPMKDYPDVTRNNFIDELIFSKLKRVNIVPSALSTDREFVRRVYLDTIGLLPTLEETARFLESKDPQKRARLIDELMERPEFAEVWATRFGDLLRVGLYDQRSKGGRLMYSWLRKAMMEDTPYNQFATELITSSGNLYFNPASNFYYITEFSEPENIATNVSQVFLGVRIECSRCHNHPWEKWTQEDFWGFAAFFGRMGVKDTYENDESEITLKPAGLVISPKTKKPVDAKYLDGPTEKEGLDEDIREKLAKWITSPENPWFARSIVNRVFKHYMGRGIVEPLDDFRVTNPPTNEALLDALAKDFVANGYRLKHTVRLILNSRTYQLSSEPNETNRADTLNYSHYYVRRLLAEELIDSMTGVTGVPEQIPGYMPGTRAMTIPQGAPTYFLQTFGRLKAREVICERDNSPDVAQAMHLISGQTIQHQITGKDGTLARWLADRSLTDEEITRRLFTATLVRPPKEREVAQVIASIQSSGGGDSVRRQAFEDVLWSIFNSKAFLFNH